MADPLAAPVMAEETAAAPDFSAADLHGRTVRLSDYQGFRTVVLVFNRGFL